MVSTQKQQPVGPPTAGALVTLIADRRRVRGQEERP